MGTVRDPRSGVAYGGANVVVSWQRIKSGGGAALDVRNERRDVTADDHGRYQLCGVPRDSRLTVRASIAGVVAPETVVIIPRERAYVVHDLTIGR